ncbi:MAG: glutathione S-transferase N-terminal domain-containing protein [Rhodoblastus sp.]|nr:MAG: glutathione S-transferase N-terminal domain-containing protein [Rhodoblastus sp.]
MKRGFFQSGQAHAARRHLHQDYCPYCQAALALLDRKGVRYERIEVTSAAIQDEMAKKAGRRTVPQIFVAGRPVGGSDDLHALDAAGKLDALLAG